MAFNLEVSKALWKAKYPERAALLEYNGGNNDMIAKRENAREHLAGFVGGQHAAQKKEE